MEGRGVLQDLIPDERHWNLPLFLFSAESLALMYIAFLTLLVTVHLLTHYGETVHTNVMTWGITLVIDGGGDPDIFLEPFPQRPCWLTYVLFFKVIQAHLNLKINPLFWVILSLS